MKSTRVVMGLAILLALPVVVQAAPPGAPPNDDYLSSSSLNRPREKLERTRTIRDPAVDTTNASVQGDVFNPGGSQPGPAEVTTCRDTSFGKTVWYDFYPDVQGFARIRAVGFDSVISVMPFDPKSFVPNFARRVCFDESSNTAEEGVVEVAKGRAYTIQIGGVDDASGTLDFRFDFLADTDGDEVLDEIDRCDRLKGPAGEAGCPRRLRASVTLRALPLSDGIRLLRLSVDAPKGSRVSVRCAGCPPQAKRARKVGFPRLRNARLRAGTSLVIRVTRRRSIGAYFAYRVTRGNFKKVERCLNPGSRKPRRKCG